MRAPVVVRFAVGHRPDHRYFVRHFRGLPQVLGKEDAIEFGLYRAEGAAVFDGRQQLGIEGFLRGDAAGQIDINDRLGRRAFAGRVSGGGRGLQLEEVAHRQAEAAQQADVKELAPVGAPGMFGTVAPGTVAGVFHRSIVDALFYSLTLYQNPFDAQNQRVYRSK